MQTANQNVLEHGKSVWNFSKKIISGQWQGMLIPEWLKENHVEIVNSLHSTDRIKHYNVYHDCGKPFCLEIDSEGKKHFPNHAEVSFTTYNQYFSDSIVANLIKEDMALHILTSEEIGLKNWTKEDAFTLLITSLAEIHANAQMFGGIDSTSFKIKYKKIDQRGKQLIKKFISVKEHNYSYVIVRNDLANAAKCVQSCHTSIESFCKSKHKHYSIICLVVKNEKKLQAVIEELLEENISVSIFREPDLGNSITAICTEPLIGNQREKLKRFQLLT